MTAFDYSTLVARNAGLVEQQGLLRNATITVAGCGAEGGSTAITLARLGVGRIHLSDPDVFDVSNMNRQWGAALDSVGHNKATVVADVIRSINPDCTVEVDTRGVGESNVASLVGESDLVIEGIDYWHVAAMVSLYRHCRHAGIPVLTGASVGWHSIAMLFEPDGLTFEEFIGANPTAPIDSFGDFQLPATTFLRKPMPYVADELQAAVLSREADIPVVAPAVNLTAAMMASLAAFRLTGQRQVAPAPAFFATDDLLLMSPVIP